MTEHQTHPIPFKMIQTVLTDPAIIDLQSGSSTHDPAFGLVGRLVRYTDDPDWITGIIAAALPENYAGNTLEEVPRMVRDSIKNGFATPGGGLGAAANALNLTQTAEFELFHTPQREAFVATKSAAGRIECHPVRSETVKGQILLRYFRAHCKTLGKDALSQVIELMQARALHECPQEEIHVRIARHEDIIYYDTGRDDGAIIKITAEGREIVYECPLRFYRPPGFVAQVLPEDGGDVDRLKALLHLDDKTWVQLLAFLLGSLRAVGPFMILLVAGGHGSGKSKLCELVKRILDPNALTKQRLPKEEHTLAIHASQHFLLVYDNASSVRWDISDALCTLSTGGGFSTRRFYTDDETRTFRNVRPVVINGIGEFADRHDLLDRAIPLKLPPMPEGARRLERDIDREFEENPAGAAGLPLRRRGNGAEAGEPGDAARYCAHGRCGAVASGGGTGDRAAGGDLHPHARAGSNGSDGRDGDQQSARDRPVRICRDAPQLVRGHHRRAPQGDHGRRLSGVSAVAEDTSAPLECAAAPSPRDGEARPDSRVPAPDGASQAGSDLDRAQRTDARAEQADGAHPRLRQEAVEWGYGAHGATLPTP